MRHPGRQARPLSRPLGRVGRYVRASMQRRLFVWFGASILVTMVAIAIVMVTLGGASFQPWRRDMEHIKSFVGGQFARVWNTPTQRDELARALARDFSLDVQVIDSQQRTLATFGSTCGRGSMIAPVVRDGVPLGEVHTCSNQPRPRVASRLLLGLLTACIVLWAASGKIARRLTRPLDELVRVAGELGAGRYSARIDIDPRHAEVNVLGVVINDMAARIEQQMKDQRELLAAVSHEIRTPLTRIRILMEMARDRGGADAKILDEVDQEIIEIDRLVSELLASSRLQFAALTISKLDAVEVARRALERAGLGTERLAVEPEHASFALTADATLLARALANLLDNARAHAGGLTRLRVIAEQETVRFEAEDDGPGVPPGEERRVFDAFVQRPTDNGNGEHEARGSLGLGLALVRRIAEAHGGVVEAKNRHERGALVSIELPRTPRLL